MKVKVISQSSRSQEEKCFESGRRVLSAHEKRTYLEYMQV